MGVRLPMLLGAGEGGDVQVKRALGPGQSSSVHHGTVGYCYIVGHSTAVLVSMTKSVAPPPVHPLEPTLPLLPPILLSLLPTNRQPVNDASGAASLSLHPYNSLTQPPRILVIFCNTSVTLVPHHNQACEKTAPTLRPSDKYHTTVFTYISPPLFNSSCQQCQQQHSDT